VRDGGCFGLLATNTIRQGDTRASGLAPIRRMGGTIYTGIRRRKWPGEAAVVVSVLHIAKADLPGPYRLDAREVPRITAFLFHDGGDDDPRTLVANQNKSFQGSIVLGMGFTFDDTDTKGVTNPTSLMQELIEKDRRNDERIFPYIGGEEVNDSPVHAHHRWVINFEDFPLCRSETLKRWSDCDDDDRKKLLRRGVVPLDYLAPVATDWANLLAIVEDKVKPVRLRDDREARRTRWWLFGDRQPGLYAMIAPMERVLVVNCGATPHLALAFLPSSMVFANTLDVFGFESFGAFSTLQSRVHEVWARFFASSMKDDLRYTPTNCFETFPLPEGMETRPRLELAGREYYGFRASLMVERNEGLTKIYNRFHDPEGRSNAIGELRRLHDAMDRAVLDAYGWTDIQPTCDFELEWEDDEADNGRRRRKPWRYRWPEPVRDEVLARLLALNAERAEEERITFGDR
jgi:hypothetical protein